MNCALLRPEVQEYLASHQDTNLDTFIFKGSPFLDVSIRELAQQLDGRRRIKSKLPLWYETPAILFPPKLNLEQTSSVFTAQYKAELASGNSLLDMTGGFGIDSYYFGQKVKEVTYIEKNEEVFAFAKANFKTLQTTTITTLCEDSIGYLKDYNGTFDTIYIDPARRDDVKGKVFKLSDCVPDVSLHSDLLLEKGKQILIKTSPLLDITAGLKELNYASEIHIIALKNEVKEVLWRITPHKIKKIRMVTVNKNGDRVDTTSCTFKELHNAVATYAEPLQYLYEPNAALMKAGAFHWVSKHYSLSKLHPHSHLYTNDSLKQFPGRSFKIIDVLPFDNKIKKRLGIKKANVTTRNFRLTVTALRKKLKINEGGDTYLFFTTDCNDNQIVIVCQKEADELRVKSTNDEG
jgi:16S rRNA G966 N2-methylase RsmD